MSNVKLFLVLAFVMVCAAGAGVGMIVDQRIHKVPKPPERPHGPLDELHLTQDQRDKMHTIWSEVQKMRDERFRDRRTMGDEREKAVVALLTPDQKIQYDRIQDGYRARVKESEDALQVAVADAESRTRAMLTPEQQTKYDEFRKHNGMPGTGRRGGGRNRNRSTTQPASAPTQAANASN